MRQQTRRVGDAEATAGEAAGFKPDGDYAPSIAHERDVAADAFVCRRREPTF